jgi:benzoate/toluate 1,2-dioxygenase alpha subunit
VPQVESYKGFIFACLNPDAPTLTEHLAETRPFIDMLADQSPDGMECCRGLPLTWSTAIGSCK